MTEACALSPTAGVKQTFQELEQKLRVSQGLWSDLDNPVLVERRSVRKLSVSEAGARRGANALPKARHFSTARKGDSAC